MVEDAQYRNFSILQDEIRRVNHNVGAVADSVGQVSAQVGQVHADLTTTQTQLNELRDKFEQFVNRAERIAAIQRSETVVGNLEAELDRTYGHYKVVRRTSIGTLQAFDIGNVTDRTVQQVSEELMIQTPRYWLAPALVALAAWSRDDKDLCDRSIEAAFTRDPAKTGLFFALVLRRQGRTAASARWLRHYLTSLDPRALTREFAVILEAASQDAFGTQGRHMIATQLTEWNDLLRADPAVTAKQIDGWVTEITTHRGTLDEGLYPQLAKVSPQWPALKDLLEHASAHGNVIAKYTAVRDAQISLSSDMADRLDNILETLVTEYDAEELPVVRDVTYHKAVIEHEGDTARARQDADALNAALDETMDVATLQTQLALHPEMLGATVGTQQIAIGVGINDFTQAVQKYAAGYRQRYIDNLDLALDGQHSTFAATLGFPGWQTNSSTNQMYAEQSLAQVWSDTVAGYLNRVRFKESNYAIAAVILIVATIFGFLINVAAGVLLMLAAAAGCGIWLYVKKTAADKLYNEAVNMREQALHRSIDIYRAALAEYVDARIAYSEEDAKANQLAELVSTWPTTVGNHEEAGLAG
ncbi:MAG: hypothetical protein QM662_15040 [Gordonia sp. (in: high G+C Gram-positive bacteria)]